MPTSNTQSNLSKTHSNKNDNKVNPKPTRNIRPRTAAGDPYKRAHETLAELNTERDQVDRNKSNAETAGALVYVFKEDLADVDWWIEKKEREEAGGEGVETGSAEKGREIGRN
jgi:hypothetical protein